MNPFDQQRKRITWGLLGFFSLLGLAAVYLIYFSYGQLRFESFYVQRNLAEDFVNRVGVALQERIATESRRAPAEYDFLISSTERFGQLSPLSNLNPAVSFPGALGYFQVDAAGQFSSPLLPEAAEQVAAIGLSDAEISSRRKVREDLRELLVVAPSDAQQAESLLQADVTGDHDNDGETAVTANRQIYDELSKTEGAYRQRSFSSGISSVAELKLKKSDLSRAQDVAKQVALKASVKETAAPQVEALAARLDPVELSETERRSVFASTINQFRLTVLNDEHVAFHRDVWHNGERRIQGFVVSIVSFTDTLIKRDFHGGQISETNDLTLVLNGVVMALIPARYRSAGALYAGEVGASDIDATDIAGNEILLQRSLPAPADQFELIVSTAALPSGPGAGALILISTILLVVIVAGFYLLNRLMHRSVDIAEQQQDFVSAVTHELKTPLTSIRMYGEILRAGWADEDKKKTYYDFIFYESERLSRLIGNVLQLARITRGSAEAVVVPQPHSIARLAEAVRAQCQAQADAAGFELVMKFEESLLDIEVLAELDAFQQVVMNLVDNAIKFSQTSTRREVEMGVRKRSDAMEFYVRDFGPGVPGEQMREIFKLFYRGESELTRETTGTGIGLALVARLVEQMQGSIDVMNKSPGAEFSVKLKFA